MTFRPHLLAWSILNVPPLTYLFELKDTNSLGITYPKNEMKKTTNSPLRLCPNLAKEIIQIGCEFKSFDHHEIRDTPE